MASGPTKLKVLRSTHEDLDLAYAERLHALYKGGRELLQNDRVMRVVFPKHALEADASYNERRARAFYDNDLALVINKISAGLAADPFKFDDGGAAKGVKEAPEIPPYWQEIMQDARPPMDGGPKRTLDEIVRSCLVEGMIAGWGWMLCDLPRPPTDEAGNPIATSMSDQERLKTDRAYPVPYQVEQVLNWHEKDKRLRWVRTFEFEFDGENPEDDRGEFTIHTWKVWDQDHITTYRLVLDKNGKDKAGREWKEDDLVPLAEDPIPHTFGQVPWVRFDCRAPDQPTFWLGDLLESRCRQLFNLACGDEYLRLSAAFQQLYEFLGKELGGPDETISEAQENPDRGRSGRAPGIVQIRGAGDDARYVAPDVAGSALNRQALEEGREAIPRVSGQLALASDTSGAVLKRSGDSKAQDKVSEQVLMGQAGQRALAFGRAVTEMLARGRGDLPDTVPKTRGYENFDTEDASTRVEEHVAFATAPLKSATAAIEHEIMVTKAVLGEGADAEMMAKVREELEGTITQESIAQSNMPPVPPGHQLDESGKPVPLPPKKPEELNPTGFGKKPAAAPAKAKK
jgi:hypothetical protein